MNNVFPYTYVHDTETQQQLNNLCFATLNTISSEVVVVFSFFLFSPVLLLLFYVYVKMNILCKYISSSSSYSSEEGDVCVCVKVWENAWKFIFWNAIVFYM